MAEFIARRILQALLVLFVMTLLVFFGVNVIGNPVYIFASSECTQACLAEYANLGLDRPIWEQYPPLPAEPRSGGPGPVLHPWGSGHVPDPRALPGHA
jgi:hypothetical protein